MPEKTKPTKTTETRRLALKLAKLVEIFRQGKSAKDFKWWNSISPRSMFYPHYGYQDGQKLFDGVVQGVLGLNSEMLSEHEVQRKLMYGFLMKQSISPTEADHLTKQHLVSYAEQFLEELIEFRAWQNIDVPISNLWLDGEPVKVGYVTFLALSEHELEQWKKDPVIGLPELPDVRVVARVKAPGDQVKAISYARSSVDQAFDILRGFCFPFGQGSAEWQIGVVGDVLSSNSTPLRIDNDVRMAMLGPGIAQIRLRKDILAKLEQLQWELVIKLVLKTYYTNMENKLLGSIHWLAESTKPDTNNAKFAKVGFALETLIGGEPKDEELKVRGITAMLAERAAFLVGTEAADRLKVDKDVRKYYGMRSKIVHGGEGDVSLDDIDGFGQLCRSIAVALLVKLNEFGDKLGTVEDLENWVRQMRYGR